VERDASYEAGRLYVRYTYDIVTDMKALSHMYRHAWRAGLKTTYYLRSRPATRINKTTTGGPIDGPGGGETLPKPTFTDEEAAACSLENPESCEACN
jgi:ribonucleoside-diphosphate reductase alpha chain